MSLDKAAVMNTLATIARDTLRYAGPIDLEMSLTEGLKLDSVGRLTLVVEVENRFQISLDPDDEARVQTVGDLVELIVARSTVDW